MPVVFTGDFAQTLPVLELLSEATTLKYIAKNAPVWAHAECYTLTDNMRIANKRKEVKAMRKAGQIGGDTAEKQLQAMEDYNEFLKQLASGDIQPSSPHMPQFSMPLPATLKSDGTKVCRRGTASDVVRAVYPEFDLEDQDSDCSHFASFMQHLPTFLEHQRAGDPPERNPAWPDIRPYCEAVGAKSILCPHNATCLEVNKVCATQLRSAKNTLSEDCDIDETVSLPLFGTCADSSESYFAAEHTYISHDTVGEVKSGDALKYLPTQEFLNSQTPNGLPPHRLTLSVGSCVVVLRNLTDSLCNGSRGIVVGLWKNFAKVLIVAGSHELIGRTCLVARIPLETDADHGKIGFVFRRTQLPLRLAYAVTVHRSQGATLKRCGLYFKSHCFAHGMAYVAFSRCGTFDDLDVIVDDDEALFDPDNPELLHTINVVHKQIL